jgi:hypothetical protein
MMGLIMRGANVAVDQENAQLFFAPGVFINRALVLGVRRRRLLITALLNLQNIPKGGCWRDARDPAPALSSSH